MACDKSVQHVSQYLSEFIIIFTIATVHK